MSPEDAGEYDTTINTTLYERRDEDESGGLLFYDFLDGPLRPLRGVEIHCDRSHPLWSALKDKSFMTFEPFPRIWFNPRREGNSRALEAFGGIRLYESQDGIWCVALAIDNWFTAEDRLVVDELLGRSGTTYGE